MRPPYGGAGKGLDKERDAAGQEILTDRPAGKDRREGDQRREEQREAAQVAAIWIQLIAK
jgi:hypothetical protein